MITIQIKVKWYDYWTKKYGPKQEHYSSIVGENTKLDTDEYESDGVFCLKVSADWKVQPKEWFKNAGGNNGIYSGANCRQYLQFWDAARKAYWPRRFISRTGLSSASSSVRWTY